MKVEKVLLFITLLSIPLQLGKHYWPYFSFLEGIRIDYLSPTIYLSDLLVLVYIIFQAKKTFFFSSFFKRNGRFISFVCIVFAINSIFAKEPLSALYSVTKLTEFFFFGLAIAYTALSTKQFVIPLSFTLTSLAETGIAIAQLSLHHSLDGIFWFLGERHFSMQTPGIALAVLNGALFLRPYATFPHPNVFAAFSLVAFVLITNSFTSTFKKRKKIVFGVGLCASSIGVIISLSRVAILLWMVSAMILFVITFKKKLNKRKTFLLGSVIISSISYVLLPRFSALFMFDLTTISERIFLLQQSFLFFVLHPLVGIGLGNFLLYLSQISHPTSFIFLQPVHNIFVLWIVETGIIGSFIGIMVLWKTVVKIFITKENFPLRFLFLAFIIFLGSVDHYFFTLQQGQLLLSLMLGIVWEKSAVKVFSRNPSSIMALE